MVGSHGSGVAPGPAGRVQAIAGRAGRGLAALVAAALGAAAPAAAGGGNDVPAAAFVRALQPIGATGTDDEKRSISGIACATPAGTWPRQCLIVGDEKAAVWQVALGEGTITYLGRVELSGSGESKELDLEAAAFLPDGQGGAYYLTGSHGASRSDASYKKARNQVFRVPVVPGTGVPQATEAISHTRNLAGVIDKVPRLAAAACHPNTPCASLAKDGLNVEGLAARDGALYFGLRNPVAGGATILKVAADALFSSSAPQPQELRVALAEELGVRDLTAVKGGFLILAGLGPTDDSTAEKRSIIYFWDGQAPAAKPLAQLLQGPSPSGAPTLPGKPEGLLLVTDSIAGEPYEVLVLFDGAENGGATLYRVAAP